MHGRVRVRNPSRKMFLDSNAKKLLSMILWRLCKIIKITGNKKGVAIGRFYSTLPMEQQLNIKIRLQIIS